MTKIKYMPEQKCQRMKMVLKIAHNVFHTSCQTGQMEIPETGIDNDR